MRSYADWLAEITEVVMSTRHSTVVVAGCCRIAGHMTGGTYSGVWRDHDVVRCAAAIDATPVVVLAEHTGPAIGVVVEAEAVEHPDGVGMVVSMELEDSLVPRDLLLAEHVGLSPAWVFADLAVEVTEISITATPDDVRCRAQLWLPSGTVHPARRR